MGFGVVFLVLAIALLALIPTRRLFVAGWRANLLTGYFLLIVILGLLVAELRGPARFLVPILVVAYVAPFITVRAGIARLMGRPEPPVVRPGPMRRVGPLDEEEQAEREAGTR